MNTNLKIIRTELDTSHALNETLTRSLESLKKEKENSLLELETLEELIDSISHEIGTSHPDKGRRYNPSIFNNVRDKKFLDILVEGGKLNSYREKLTNLSDFKRATLQIRNYIDFRIGQLKSKQSALTKIVSEGEEAHHNQENSKKILSLSNEIKIYMEIKDSLIKIENSVNRDDRNEIADSMKNDELLSKLRRDSSLKKDEIVPDVFDIILKLIMDILIDKKKLLEGRNKFIDSELNRCDMF